MQYFLAKMHQIQPRWELTTLPDPKLAEEGPAPSSPNLIFIVNHSISSQRPAEPFRLKTEQNQGTIADEKFRGGPPSFLYIMQYMITRHQHLYPFIASLKNCGANQHLGLYVTIMVLMRWIIHYFEFKIHN